jgi:hypothetical protein
MTTDKLSAAMWDELAEAHAEAGHEYDAITRACRRRGDEAARRVVVETRPLRILCDQDGAYCTVARCLERGSCDAPKGRPTPAPPANERAELVKRLLEMGKSMIADDPDAYLGDKAAALLERDAARIAELERTLEAWRKDNEDQRARSLRAEKDAAAAQSRAEAAEARIAELDAELEATKCGEAESWPVWADKIVNLLVKHGFEPGDGGWNLPDDLAEWIDGIDFAAHAKDAKEEAAALRSALRAAMDDVPGWYDLARAALAQKEPGNG